MLTQQARREFLDAVSAAEEHSFDQAEIGRRAAVIWSRGRTAQERAEMFELLDGGCVSVEADDPLRDLATLLVVLTLALALTALERFLASV